MGVLVDAESASFLLPHEAFPAAHAALRELATDEPEEFFDPDQVAEATDFLTALPSADWAVDRDECGDIVKLWYAADKAPRDSHDYFPLPILRALAPSIQYGSMKLKLDGDDIFEFVIENGEVEYYQLWE
jgi:hypothetical protein